MPQGTGEQGAGPGEDVLIYSVAEGRVMRAPRVAQSDAEWREQLTPESYQVARRKGTERAFRGAYWDHHEPGVYRCVGCGTDLFDSARKFDSGTGWPSFWAPVAAQNIVKEVDDGWFQRRTEVLCVRCGSHLGHVFDDGPAPSGERYCINSAALTFAALPLEPSRP